MPRPVKTVVEEVFGFQRTSTLWTANYYPALPIAPQDFDIGALLPAILYMARWGHRRGRGNFVSNFGRLQDGNPQPPTIADVEIALLGRANSAMEGFDGDIGNAVLGLLRCNQA